MQKLREVSKMEAKDFNAEIMNVLFEKEEIHRDTLFIIWELWRLYLDENDSSCLDKINNYYLEILNKLKRKGTDMKGNKNG